ncbi:Asp-tRNA(Asn)/Glu-tRNA(Gln) amidotransferase subunit GatA [Ostreibacterium oceani]|uniref:Glutamyl-tRNA(Gln) amidotransferase subunit A n=1 Tax=Ostreibacterium oceani TaxID=2654998 RepID=A0A6N7F3H9_9GAMM|nr:Asp-tRNA(Asn)/Glu-tRNA(Gln) amidotransferase subunit GatA [Ostreibacterium oceani]MPV86426.1 Asp-tRNA(Asn)/Glu-tRNA(Gln) amidotransferase subunit GatA [Ostreibacterium oceani]
MLRHKTITELHTLLRDNKLSVAELTQETLKHIKTDPHNAILSTCEGIMPMTTDATNAAQQQFSAGDASPLTGIPIIYKDNFNITGTLTTCASNMLANYRSVYTATVVERMQATGSISIAKANMDEFAMGSTNENSAFGAVNNPFNPAHCAGGSSGGSAAAVASGLAPVAFGSDTGGSVRQPAAFCGVTGLKPTYGRLSRFGVIAFASSFDQPGIFSKTAADCATVLAATAAHDDKDSTSVKRETDDYVGQLGNAVQGKTIGLVRDLFDRVQSAEAQARYEDAIRQYEKLGVTFIDVELPNPELCVAAYYILSSSECSSNLSRYDGVRYGHRSVHSDDLNALYTASRTEGFGPEVKRRILLGTFALSAGYYDAYYLKAQKMRRVILNRFNELFENIDSILLPTSLITAPKLGQDFDYNDDMCTISANLAGLPAISHPIGLANGLPVGIQLIGKHFAEANLLNLVHQFQQQSDFHLLIPPA